MQGLRKKRLEAQFAQRISELIAFELEDPHVHDEIISLTRVELSSDFMRASIYFTLLNVDHKNRVIKALYRCAPYIHRLLRKRIRMGKLPELRFFYDEEGLRDLENPDLPHVREKNAALDDFLMEPSEEILHANEDYPEETREGLHTPPPKRRHVGGKRPSKKRRS